MIIQSYPYEELITAIDNDQKWFNTYIQTGWKCPECGCVYSPYMYECYRCNSKRQLEIDIKNANNS